MLKTDLETEPDEPTPEFMLDLHLQSDWQILSVQMLIDYQVSPTHVACNCTGVCSGDDDEMLMIV